ncbi:hypothetical protein CSUI_010709 [Cystoisospora suis]|uniref:Uncharacterized protein n=1 Tax=Cystoisospora suis TaxID=483139 RepID=A0A2C6JWH4_9APIC|nr:hypothetical protein CSUI_010709 [Cystoisospora suis]
MREATLRMMRREELVETCCRLQRSCQDLQSSLEELRENGARLQSEKSGLECEVHDAGIHLTRLQRDDGVVGNFFKDIGIHQFSDFIQQVRTQTPEAAAAVAAALGSSAQALVKDTQRHSFGLPAIPAASDLAKHRSPSGLSGTQSQAREFQEESAEGALRCLPCQTRKTPAETAKQFARSVTEAAAEAWHRTSTQSLAALAAEGIKGEGTVDSRGDDNNLLARKEGEADTQATPEEPLWQDPFADELVMKAVGQQGGNSLRALMQRKCTEERLQKEVAQWLKDADSMSVEEVPRGPLCHPVLQMGSCSLSPELCGTALFPARPEGGSSLLGSVEQGSFCGAVSPVRGPDSPEGDKGLIKTSDEERQRARLVCDARLLALQVERALGMDNLQRSTTSGFPPHSSNSNIGYLPRGVQRPHAGPEADSKEAQNHSGVEIPERDTADSARDKAKVDQWETGFAGDSRDLDDLCARVLGGSRNSRVIKEAAEASSTVAPSCSEKEGQEDAEHKEVPGLCQVRDILKISPKSPEKLTHDSVDETPSSKEPSVSHKRTESGDCFEGRHTERSTDEVNPCQAHYRTTTGGSPSTAGERVFDSAIAPGSAFRERKEATISLRTNEHRNCQKLPTPRSMWEKGSCVKEDGDSMSLEFRSNPASSVSRSQFPQDLLPSGRLLTGTVAPLRRTTGPCATAPHLPSGPRGGTPEETVSTSPGVAVQTINPTADPTEGDAVTTSGGNVAVNPGASVEPSIHQDLTPSQQRGHRAANGGMAVGLTRPAQSARDPRQRGGESLPFGATVKLRLSPGAGPANTHRVAIETQSTDVSESRSDPIAALPGMSSVPVSPGARAIDKDTVNSGVQPTKCRNDLSASNLLSSRSSPSRPAIVVGPVPTFGDEGIARGTLLTNDESAPPSSSLSFRSSASSDRLEQRSNDPHLCPHSDGVLLSSCVPPASSPTMTVESKMLPDQRVLLSWHLGEKPRALVASAPAGVHRQIEVQLSILDLTAEFEAHDTRSQPGSVASPSAAQSTPPIRTARASTMLLDNLKVGREYHLTLIGRCIDLDLSSGVEESHAEPVCGVTVHFHLQPDGLKSLRCRPVSLAALGFAHSVGPGGHVATVAGQSAGNPESSTPGSGVSENRAATGATTCETGVSDGSACCRAGRTEIGSTSVDLSGGQQRTSQECSPLSFCSSVTKPSSWAPPPLPPPPPSPLPRHAADSSCMANYPANSVPFDLSSASMPHRNSVPVPHLGLCELIHHPPLPEPGVSSCLQGSAVSHAGVWTPASCHLRSSGESHSTDCPVETARGRSGAQGVVGGVIGSPSLSVRPSGSALAAVQTVSVSTISDERSASDPVLGVSQHSRESLCVAASRNFQGVNARSGPATTFVGAQGGSYDGPGFQPPSVLPPRSVPHCSRTNSGAIPAWGSACLRSSSGGSSAASRGRTVGAASVFQLPILSSAWRAVKETAVAGQAVIETVASRAMFSGPAACGRQQRGRPPQEPGQRRQHSLGCVDIRTRDWEIGDECQSGKERTTSHVRSSSSALVASAVVSQTAVPVLDGSSDTTKRVSSAGGAWSRHFETRTERSPPRSQQRCPELNVAKAVDVFFAKEQLWVPPQKVRVLAAARVRCQGGDSAGMSHTQASPGTDWETHVAPSPCPNLGGRSAALVGHKTAILSSTLGVARLPSRGRSHAIPTDAGTCGLRIHATEGPARFVEGKGTRTSSGQINKGTQRQELGVAGCGPTAQTALDGTGLPRSLPSLCLAPVASESVAQQGGGVASTPLSACLDAQRTVAPVRPQSPCHSRSSTLEHKEDSSGSQTSSISCSHLCIPSVSVGVSQVVNETQARRLEPAVGLVIPSPPGSATAHRNTPTSLSVVSPVAPPTVVPEICPSIVAARHPEKSGSKAVSPAVKVTGEGRRQATEALEKLSSLRSEERELERLIETRRLFHEQRQKQADLLRCALRGSRQVVTDPSEIPGKHGPAAADSKEESQRANPLSDRRSDVVTGASFFSSLGFVLPPVPSTAEKFTRGSSDSPSLTRAQLVADVSTPTAPQAKIRAPASLHHLAAASLPPVAASSLGRHPSRSSETETRTSNVSVEGTHSVSQEKHGRDTSGSRHRPLLGHARGVTQSGSLVMSLDRHYRQLRRPRAGSPVPHQESVVSATACTPIPTKKATGLSERVLASESRASSPRASSSSLNHKAATRREAHLTDSVGNAASAPAEISRMSRSDTVHGSSNSALSEGHCSPSDVATGSGGATSSRSHSAAVDHGLPRCSVFPLPQSGAAAHASASCFPSNRHRVSLLTGFSGRTSTDGSCGVSIARSTAPVPQVYTAGQPSPLFYADASRNGAGRGGIHVGPCTNPIHGGFLSQPFHPPVTVPSLEPRRSEVNSRRSPRQYSTSAASAAISPSTTSLVHKQNATPSPGTQMSKQEASNQATVLLSGDSGGPGALGRRQVTFY